MRELHNVVRHQVHENRTKTGRVSATVTRKIANYLAYGRADPSNSSSVSRAGPGWTKTASRAPMMRSLPGWRKRAKRSGTRTSSFSP
ncbi:MAG: hypothetical protein IPJ90_10015 [Anaerolineaceae bacterium]|nr:hypothetical protein [Anaerolineaceae bacterium]